MTKTGEFTIPFIQNQVPALIISFENYNKKLISSEKKLKPISFKAINFPLCFARINFEINNDSKNEFELYMHKLFTYLTQKMHYNCSFLNFNFC